MGSATQVLAAMLEGRLRSRWAAPPLPPPPAAAALPSSTLPRRPPTLTVLDVVARVSHELLQRLGAEAGGCVQVSAQEMGRLLALPEVAASMMRCARRGLLCRGDLTLGHGW